MRNGRGTLACMIRQKQACPLEVRRKLEMGVRLCNIQGVMMVQGTLVLIFRVSETPSGLDEHGCLCFRGSMRVSKMYELSLYVQLMAAFATILEGVCVYVLLWGLCMDMVAGFVFVGNAAKCSCDHTFLPYRIFTQGN